MTFLFPYTIRLNDTDAAGVVYFANVLNLCHIAYEAAIAHTGMTFAALIQNGEFILPITYCQATFKRPLHCDDSILIHVQPDLLKTTEFTLNYELRSLDAKQCYAIAQTQHTCIDPQQRQRRPLPDAIAHWHTHL